MDLKSFDRWDDYTRARDEMFEATDTRMGALVRGALEEKKRVRLNIISHLLEHVPYEEVPSAQEDRAPKRKIGGYTAVELPFKYVPEAF